MPSSTIPNVTGFILAAGEGRRLRPATMIRPKALIPFCGVPLLELTVARLTELPVTGIVVNAWHHAEQVAAACTELSTRLKWPICVSREAALQDTGGGLRDGLRLAPDADLFLVHNADVVLDFDLRELLAAHQRRQADATVLLVPGRGPRTVNLSPEGRITAFRQPATPDQLTFSGVYLIHRRVLDLLPATDPCSIIPALEEALRQGLRIYGIATGDAFWSDLGRPADYIRAHGEVADRGLRHSPRLREAVAEQARRRAALERQGVRCTGALGLGDDLRIPAGAHLHNAVIWDHTSLPRPVLYADSIFTDGKTAGRPVEAGRRPDPRIAACLDANPDTLTLEPLRKQGSGRMYARLRAPGDRSWIWCAYSPERRENAAFTALAEFLDRLGINIPSILLHLGDAGELVTLDLGSHDLLSVETPWQIETYLRDVLRQAARLHVLGDRAARLEELPLQAGFTKGLYDWERDYFREHILGRLLGRPDLWTPAVATAWCDLRNRLLEQPQVPVHRDLQSANIMVFNGKPYMIDFQGMRLGCAAYDVASLLFDPYKAHPSLRRRALWNFYQQQVRELGGAPTPPEIFHAAAVQRLLQALGAYGKLWLNDGLDWYRPYVIPALNLLQEAAGAAGCTQIAGLAETTRTLAAARLDTAAPSA